MSLSVWPSKRLDLSIREWLFAAAACAVPGPAEAAERVERRWSPGCEAVVGLSVRTLFDLWLKAQRSLHAWSAGDRIVFTALTIADMPAIARAHGFEVASVDIGPETTEPDLGSLAALLTPRTRALVFTHLFGARADVRPALEIAKARGIAFVEDCAEAYAGPSWRGHPGADVALFSFGPIKTATALGGALARVAEGATRERMKELARGYPEQTRANYAGKVLKYGLLALAGIPWLFGAILVVLRAAGVDHDRLLQRLTRGFPGPELLPQIRRRPSSPLLRMLELRLAEGDRPWRRRVAPGERLVRSLEGALVPTARAQPHGYWLVPVEAPEPSALVERLGREGLHATRGRAFAVVESDPGVGARPPVHARRLHSGLVYLPFSPEMSDAELDRLGRVVRAELERQALRRHTAPIADDARRRRLFPTKRMPAPQLD